MKNEGIPKVRVMLQENESTELRKSVNVVDLSELTDIDTHTTGERVSKVYWKKMPRKLTRKIAFFFL